MTTFTMEVGVKLRLKSNGGLGKALARVAQMPALPHAAAGRPFDIRESTVMRWIVSQPEVLAWLFGAMRASGAIVFHRQSRQWRGRQSENQNPQ